MGNRFAATQSSQQRREVHAWVFYVGAIGATHTLGPVILLPCPGQPHLIVHSTHTVHPWAPRRACARPRGGEQPNRGPPAFSSAQRACLVDCHGSLPRWRCCHAFTARRRRRCRRGPTVPWHCSALAACGSAQGGRRCASAVMRAAAPSQNDQGPPGGLPPAFLQGELTF